MSNEWKKILKFAQQNSFLYTILSASLSVALQCLPVFYQIAHNYYFNVTIHKIDISNNNLFFVMIMYLVLCAIILAINYLGYEFYKRHKFLSYLVFFGMMFFILGSVFIIILSKTLLPLSSVFKALFQLLLISIIMTLTLNSLAISTIFSPPLKDKIEIAEFKLNKSSNEKKKIKLQNTLTKLREQETLINSYSVKSSSLLTPIIVTIVAVSMIFMSALIFGYTKANTKKDFKIIANEYIELKTDNYRKAFAVVYESREQFVAVPCEIDNNNLKLYVNEQITIYEDNILIIEKKFDKVYINYSE